MNFGIRREEAIYLRDLILVDRASYPDETIKNLYGNIDIVGMLRQLDIIIELGDSVDGEVIF